MGTQSLCTPGCSLPRAHGSLLSGVCACPQSLACPSPSFWPLGFAAVCFPLLLATWPRAGAAKRSLVRTQDVCQAPGLPGGLPCLWLWPLHCPGCNSPTPTPGARDGWAIPRGCCRTPAGSRAVCRTPSRTSDCHTRPRGRSALPVFFSLFCLRPRRIPRLSIHSTSIFLNNYYVPGTVVGAEVNRTDKSCFPGADPGEGRLVGGRDGISIQT